MQILVFEVLFGLEFVEIIKWGINNCEIFGLYLFVEERSNMSNFVVGDVIFLLSCFEFLVDGKLEKVFSEEFNVVEKL